jgi:serine/threonine protein kinase
MPDGSLFNKILKSGGLKGDLAERSTFRQIVAGVKFCHDHDIAHMDLKPQNMFLKGSQVKIGDFGFAMKSAGKTKLPITTIRYESLSSRSYQAPEILRKSVNRFQTIRDTSLDMKAVDVWALGVTFYVVLTGREPWKGGLYSQDEVTSFLQRLDEKGLEDVYIPLPGSVDQGLADLIQHMLQPDPFYRYTIGQVAEHKFFRRVALDAIEDKNLHMPLEDEDLLRLVDEDLLRDVPMDMFHDLTSAVEDWKPSELRAAEEDSTADVFDSQEIGSTPLNDEDLSQPPLQDEDLSRSRWLSIQRLRALLPSKQ